MPHPFCIEQLTVSAMDPVEHVTLAAELGCRAVTLALEQGPRDGLPGWTLRRDPGLRARLSAALAEREVAIVVGEGAEVSAEFDAARHAADLDIFAKLGACRVSAADVGLEQSRAFDQLAVLCEMVRERGMDFVVEWRPGSALRTLSIAREALRHVGEGKAGLLIDSIVFFRTGGTVREIAGLDPAVIEHVRLSDAPRKITGGRSEAARAGRLTPGEGELPLREFVDALPRGQRLGLAVSHRDGRPIVEQIAEALMKTRALLA